MLFLSGRAAVMAFAEGEDDITISFHANGASGSPPASITVEKGETFTLPFDSGGMTKEGYSLVRWSVTPDGSTNTWSLGSQECFYEDTVLYAVWGEGHLRHLRPERRNGHAARVGDGTAVP